MDIKQYIPQILAMLTLAAGGGTLGVTQYNASDRADDMSNTATHTAGLTADLIIKIYTLEERISKLEASRGLESDTQ